MDLKLDIEIIDGYVEVGTNDDCITDAWKRIKAALAAQPVTVLEGELLPCPFCGGKAEINGSGAMFYTVECETGCVYLPSAGRFTSKYNAIKCWNTRALQKKEG